MIQARFSWSGNCSLRFLRTYPKSPKEITYDKYVLIQCTKKYVTRSFIDLFENSHGYLNILCAV